MQLKISDIFAIKIAFTGMILYQQFIISYFLRERLYRFIASYIVDHIDIYSRTKYVSNINMAKQGADASVVRATGNEQLLEKPQEAGPRLSHGKPSRRAVTTLGSNDLVVGEDH